MLTSHTSSEEEKIPYLQKFAQTTGKNNECPQLLENTADQHACYHKLWERRPQVPDLINSSPPSPPPGQVSQFPWKNSSTVSAE